MYNNYGTIQKIRWQNNQIIMDVTNPMGEEVMFRFSNQYSADSKYLQILAYFGERPSTEDEIIGNDLPMVFVNGVWGIPNVVAEQGSLALENAEWFSGE